MGDAVHRTTIMQTIHKAGLYEGVVRRKALLKKKSHLKASLELFKKHTENCKDGKKKREGGFLWSEKTKMDFFFWCYIWWKPNTAHWEATPTVKHEGGSIMLSYPWPVGCFSDSAILYLVFVWWTASSKESHGCAIFFPLLNNGFNGSPQGTNDCSLVFMVA